MHEAMLAASPTAVDGNDSAAAAARRRIDDQIDWYDRKSGHNQRWFKRLKVGQIVLAAAIPAAASLGAHSDLLAVCGALIVVLEGLQQLQQYQQNWTAYRATCERLKHERHLFEAQAGPYAGVARPAALLAERVEGLVSQEHAAWATQQREATKAAVA
jgi:hypothetical protein